MNDRRVFPDRVVDLSLWEPEELAMGLRGLLSDAEEYYYVSAVTMSRAEALGEMHHRVEKALNLADELDRRRRLQRVTK